MKKGFTMIELVFVIVILGILASLAVPKLAATRDDAEAAKAAVEIKDAITQLTTYYIVNGLYTDEAHNKDVTTLDKNKTGIYSKTIEEVLGRSGNKWTDCITLTTSNGDKDKPANIKVAKKDNGTSSFCSAVRGTQAFKDWSKLTDGIQVGGSGIFKEGTTTTTN
ncbi:type II secretion system protein [Campylobacter hyointestinalis]|uniref:type II secretion system protein n=1 Tax=Campylobacter hyointestinalis TaxID=198 RepID=UPI002554AD8A|nr:prepilin-type N-terminal cleavage/methylation domain-containing protein [Campylobacter hyointestinalis]MDL2346413.1 prepilin-type N-terminal cleavage/methylation domain-containing protein [Campylobacter hyointestinalis]MDL2348153.1 prepilin-type N-terminal cleavage/methylation domain-containing protein [Campylobacter hyointestinalis]MDL2349898.1 prepilin-type N-terminal cleavage/methylation domain-containing protein [Campylobacter hyointestinalis]MDM1025425.1 prepilin-type N-terminal cleavag